MYKRRRSPSWKRKQRRRPWYIYAAAIISIPIGLELLTRLVFAVTGIDHSFATQASDQSKQVQSYQLSFLSPDRQAYALPHQGQLRAIRSPLLGYQLLPQQKNDYWSINPQGFREDQPISLVKEPNEVRIFVLGGSMAFGQLSSSNQATLSSQLETLLNQRVKEQQANPTRFQPATLPYTADEVAKVLQRPARIPERRYRVINAAVPGYASGNDLAMLSQQVSAYSPDMLILLNGYEDLLLPSDRSGADVPGLDTLIAGKRETKNDLGETLQGWFHQLALVQGVEHFLLRPAKAEDPAIIPLNLPVIDQPLAQSLASDGAELDARISRYQANLLQMMRWSAATRKRLLIGIQPELSSRPSNQMSSSEQAILAKLGEDYSQRIEPAYRKLTAAAKQSAQAVPTAKVLDLNQLYSDSQEPAFQTPTSLTDAAYKRLAERFYQDIASQLAIEPKPYGGG
jgi:lysophospholipase L1-like esterase